MFNVPLNTDVPGFRVGLLEDVPGFNIDSDGSPRRAVGNSSSYDVGNLTRPFWGSPIGLQSWTANDLGRDLGRATAVDHAGRRRPVKA